MAELIINIFKRYSPHPEGQSVQLHHGLDVELEKQPISIEIFGPHPAGLLDLSGLSGGLHTLPW